MNKTYAQEIRLYPEQKRETVFSTPDGYTVDRIELVKVTRQLYVKTWYVVYHNGVPQNAWKTIGGAVGQIGRLQNPARRGRPKSGRMTIEDLTALFNERPDIREFMDGVMELNLTHAELQALVTALKIAKENGTKTATDWLKEHWPAPFEE